AAAEAKATLLSLASVRLGVPIARLTAAQGVISDPGDPKKKISYADLIGGQQFNLDVTGKLQPKNTNAHRISCQAVYRIDIPFKVTGAHTYVQDLRLPDMVHGRPVRPPAFGARLVAVEESSVKDVPGLIRVVAKGNFVGVVCDREEQAIRAARNLKITWEGSQVLPPMSELHAALRKIPSNDRAPANTGDVEGTLAGATKTL